MAYWNTSCKSIPPITTIKYSEDDLEAADKLSVKNSAHYHQLVKTDWASGLQNILSKMCEHFDQSSVLTYLLNEGSYLDAFNHYTQRFTTRYKRIIVQITKDLHQLMDLKLIELLKSLSRLASIKRKNCRLPSTRLMVHLLCCMVGSFFLLLQVENKCIKAAIALRQYLSKAYFYRENCTYYAFISRIRVLAIDLAFVIGEFYENLFSFVIGMKGGIELIESSALPSTVTSLLKEISNNNRMSQEYESQETIESRNESLNNKKDWTLNGQEMQLSSLKPSEFNEDLGCVVQRGGEEIDRGRLGAGNQDHSSPLLEHLQQLSQDLDAKLSNFKMCNDYVQFVQQLQEGGLQDLLQLQCIKRKHFDALKSRVDSIAKTHLSETRKKKLMKLQINLYLLRPNLKGKPRLWIKKDGSPSLLEALFSKKLLEKLDKLKNEL